MSLGLIRSESNAALWSACAARFLDATGTTAGPEGHRAWIWVAHRSQRDDLLEEAARRGSAGWLEPPVSFFSELPERFGIEERPVGILTARLLVSRKAAELGRRHGLAASGGPEGGPVRSHMLDAVFSELLPEGVTPRELRAALARLDGDDFSRRRNEWVAATYAAFLEELDRGNRYDPRSVHARIARRIEDGGLPSALSGATELHVYGIVSLRSRIRLFRALAEQEEVSVSVYLPLEAEPSEWEERLPVEEVEVLEPRSREIGAGRRPRGRERPGAVPRDEAVEVRPVPDALREARWIARRVKGLLVEEGTEPRRIAVVARTGRDDTGRIHEALRAAGVPSTARLRTRLDEVPALRALLLLFGGQADGWDDRALREVATSPYLAPRLDARILDFLAGRRRIEGLEAWAEALEGLAPLLEGDEAWRYRRAGVHEERLEEAREALAGLREEVAPLGEARPEAGWIHLTLELLAGRACGRGFDLRRRLCHVPGERHDIVRLDQRGVRTLESLLREWGELVDSDRALEPAEWHERLRHLLEANEIALSTPLRTGVQVLEANEAALTPYDHVFVVHANDGVFPRTPRASGAFSEAERARLRELGLPLSGREERLRRERSLWRAVTGSDRVTISYRTTDARGVPLLPSLMVPDHDPATELPRVLDAVQPEAQARGGGEAAAGPGAGGEPASPEEHRRLEVLRLGRLRRGGESTPFDTPDPARLRHAVLAAHAEELRAREPTASRPHPWNGALRDPEVREFLERRFDEEYVWSASQLQAYGTRPFDFLLDRVLGIREAERAEEETSPLEFGAVAHDILERFYRGYVEGDDGAPPEALDADAEARLERAVREACEAAEEDAGRWLGLPAFWAVRREEIVEAVRAFLAHELPRIAKKGERPVALELSFGAHGEESESPPVLIEGRDVWGGEGRLRLRGRIDRVDRCGDGADDPLKVIDYKSGGYPTRYDDGATLQTALYMEAVERLERGEAAEGVYRSIRKRRMDGGRLTREETEDVLAFALAVPRRVRAGLFEAVQAASARLAFWQPGVEVTRTEARFSEGSRWEAPPEEMEVGAPDNAREEGGPDG